MVQCLLGSWQIKTIRKPQLWVDQKSRGKAENVTISDEDEDDFQAALIPHVFLGLTAGSFPYEQKLRG